MGIRHKLGDLGARARRFAEERPGAAGRAARFLRYEGRLWSACFRRLRDNNATAMSAALSFRTIFAMIPSLVLVILMLRMLGVQEDARVYLQGYIDRSGITVIRIQAQPVEANQPASKPKPAPRSAPASAPATAPAEDVVSIEGQLNKVIQLVEEKVTLGRLGPIGVVLLIWTALTLMTTVERSLNRIFHAPAGRSVGRRTLLYWSALTLGPVALIAALAAGELIMSRAKGFVESQAWLSWVLIPLGVLQPVVVGVFLFAAAYALIPNTKVRLRSALAGAIVAFPVWLVAMWGFGMYVTQVVGTDPLYGTLGLLPLFLLWLHASWLTFLFGGELAHTSDELHRGGMQLDDDQDAGDALVTQWDCLAAALAVAGPYATGKGPVSETDVVARLRIRPRNVRIVLEDLVQRKLLCPVEQAETDSYVPGLPVDKTRVADVIDLAGPEEKSPDRAAARPYEKDLAEAIDRARQAAREALGQMTLADLLEKQRP